MKIEAAQLLLHPQRGRDSSGCRARGADELAAGQGAHAVRMRSDSAWRLWRRCTWRAVFRMMDTNNPFSVLTYLHAMTAWDCSTSTPIWKCMAGLSWVPQKRHWFNGGPSEAARGTGKTSGGNMCGMPAGVAESGRQWHVEPRGQWSGSH